MKASGTQPSNALGFFLESAGYPERPQEGASSFVMRVDGMEVLAEEAERNIRLSYTLTEDEALLEPLARFAAGRMLREDAVFAYGRRRDAAGREKPPAAFIWQAAPAHSDGHDMLRLFETFMDSCDWWRDRVRAFASSDETTSSPPDTMMIRP